jgi:hypothetical protein
MEIQMGDVSKLGWLSYQRHIAGFLVLPVGGVRFNLQDLHFFPTYSVTFFISMLD